MLGMRVANSFSEAEHADIVEREAEEPGEHILSRPPETNVKLK